MAERRMFAKSIVLSDVFLDMPMSARCLYFTLGMLADDDGFVGNPKSIMRQCGASQDDMLILLQKRYILGFESGVIVIKHWRMNNYLRNDRHQDTTYLEEKELLTIDNKGAYTEKDGNKALFDVGIPSDNQVTTVYGYTEDRIGKDSKGKDKYICAFDEFWKNYPRKKDKARAYKCYCARLNDGYTEDQLLTACINYAAECDHNKTEERYIKHGATFLSVNEPFLDYLKGESDDVAGRTRDDEEQRNAEIDRYLESDEFKNDNDLPFM